MASERESAIHLTNTRLAGLDNPTFGFERQKATLLIYSLHPLSCLRLDTADAPKVSGDLPLVELFWADEQDPTRDIPHAAVRDDEVLRGIPLWLVSVNKILAGLDVPYQYSMPL